jgi:hypothetical protein
MEKWNKNSKKCTKNNKLWAILCEILEDMFLGTFRINKVYVCATLIYTLLMYICTYLPCELSIHAHIFNDKIRVICVKHNFLCWEYSKSSLYVFSNIQYIIVKFSHATMPQNTKIYLPYLMITFSHSCSLLTLW